MKATQVKSLAAKVMTAGFLAGVLIFVGPAKAEAQQFSVGIQVGRPVVYPDYYARRDYYDHLRWEQARREEIEREEWIRRQEWLRRQEWIRRHEWMRHERWEHKHRYESYPDGYYGR